MRFVSLVVLAVLSITTATLMSNGGFDAKEVLPMAVSLAQAGALAFAQVLSSILVNMAFPLTG